ncbi:lipase-like PAD4 [Hordeum vulgare]|uniref:Predicted protein n=2 Tax=Hordeum vulgare subsp. vulgare TaxID=112509 RepID=F2D2N2_HORVV|nr:lipase-like PAD4 [Hordeum vulgare subsp. vulgare]KAE8790915.1 lipase-like PAD4 [Hordeum vulgare]BAJ89353.1 predicted protein [Hordeum vulgare subsp. vulgare]
MEDAEENSMFETSHVLGALLASSPLLARAWDRCVAAAAMGAASSGFAHGDGGGDGGTVYVAFSGLQAALSVAGPAVASGADVFAPVGLAGDAAGARAFPQLAAAEPDAAAAVERVAVQALALRCFLKLCGSPEFQMLLNQIRGKAVVFTGHSLGGAIAALAALHYLCITSLSSPCSPSPPVLCVTFGSPLLGNEALSRAILRERWGGNFCNVVSQHDVVPRLLFCPLDAVPVHVIIGMQLQQWAGHTHNTGVMTTRVVDAEQEGLRQLIQAHVRMVAMEQKLVDPESRGGSPYRPFGAYVLCSPEGAVCVDNSTAAVQMLYATFVACYAQGDTTSLGAAHSCYGDLVLKMPQNLLLKRRPRAMDVLASMSNSNYDAGISLAMEASGIGSEAMEATMTRYWLKASKRAGRSPSLNCAGLAIRLGRITPCRAQVEWYKASFDGNMGYYDAFKQRRSPKKFNKADMCRIKLGQFWDGVLAMLDNSQLPHDFHRRAKWVNAARFYQLLVEPLDIAHYHRNNLHRTRGGYITHGRDRRYELFDKWWKEKGAFTGTSTGDMAATARSKYAGLTQDPCFWARVEEARDQTESAQAEQDVAMLAMKLGRLREFERYARELVEGKEVSIDVLAPQSSYTLWVEEWKKLLLRDEARAASLF